MNTNTNNKRRSNELFPKFEAKYPGIENKFNEFFVEIIDKSIEYQLIHNRNSQRLNYANHFPKYIPEASPSLDQDLFDFIRGRISDEFKKYRAYWKQYRTELPNIFTPEYIRISYSTLPSKYKRKASVQKSVFEQFSIPNIEQTQEQKKIQKFSTDDNIVTIKLDGLKENYFSVTYSNVNDSDKELILKHTVEMVNVLNTRHREFV